MLLKDHKCCLRIHILVDNFWGLDTFLGLAVFKEKEIILIINSDIINLNKHG